MSKKLDDALREKWVKLTKEWLESIDEEAIKYKTNEICIPTVDEAGNDKYVQFVIKIPKGSRDGEEFDGYSMREEYEIILKGGILWIGLPEYRTQSIILRSI